jgi:hypothetical protein
VTRISATLSISATAVRLPGDHPEQQGGAVKYMLLIHQGDTPTPRDPEAWARLSDDEQKAVYADYQAINGTPGVTSGLALEDPATATTVRVENGQTLTTDGPFVAVKEALGGYLVYEADDLDAAIELAARIPAARMGGAIEIRPIAEW